MNLSRLVACAIVFYSFSAAAEEPTPGPHAPESEVDARQAYQKGQTHYDLGEYPEAIALFREAYELSSVPAFLFDIAQAYRLSGDCAKALGVYRHFIRLDPQSSRRSDADAYIETLGAECGTKRLPPAEPPVSVPPAAILGGAAPQAPQPEPPDAHRPKTAVMPKLGWALVGTAAILGIGAGSLYLWNGDRYATWAKEDRALAMSGAVDPAQRASLVDRQNANDNLLSSIHGFDRATVVLAGTSAACVVAAAVIALVKLERPPDVAVGPRGMQLSWRLEP